TAIAILVFLTALLSGCTINNLFFSTHPHETNHLQLSPLTCLVAPSPDFEKTAKQTLVCFAAWNSHEARLSETREGRVATIQTFRITGVTAIFRQLAVK